LITVDKKEPLKNVLGMMKANDFSQIPVIEDGRIVGSVTETLVFNKIISEPSLKDQPVGSIMQPAFPFVDISTPIDDLAAMLKSETDALLVKDFKQGTTFIITRYDVLDVLAQ